jgi:hypothetical protein
MIYNSNNNRKMLTPMAGTTSTPQNHLHLPHLALKLVPCAFANLERCRLAPRMMNHPPSGATHDQGAGTYITAACHFSPRRLSMLAMFTWYYTFLVRNKTSKHIT